MVLATIVKDSDSEYFIIKNDRQTSNDNKYCISKQFEYNLKP